MEEEEEGMEEEEEVEDTEDSEHFLTESFGGGGLSWSLHGSGEGGVGETWIRNMSLN